MTPGRSTAAIPGICYCIIIVVPAVVISWKIATKFERRFNHLQKELVCPRCRHAFAVTKKNRPAFGPLLGHDPEIAD